jgi:GNAT superfamily N-acetyltransferase
VAPRAAASPARARIAERLAPRLWVATLDDAQTVAELLGGFRDWFGYSEPTDANMRASVERLLADPATDYLLGAVDAGGAAGAAAGVCQLRYRYSVWTGRDDAWLEDVFVRDEARGTGLGRALVEFTMERARERGCGRIQLDVNTANGPAKALYESLGFSPWQDHPGGDALYMTRKLD